MALAINASVMDGGRSRESWGEIVGDKGVCRYLRCSVKKPLNNQYQLSKSLGLWCREVSGRVSGLDELSVQWRDRHGSTRLVEHCVTFVNSVRAGHYIHLSLHCCIPSPWAVDILVYSGLHGFFGGKDEWLEQDTGGTIEGWSLLHNNLIYCVII